MRILGVFSLSWMVAVLVACVTINVYFPAVAAERAADQIIQDVWGQTPPPGGAETTPAEQPPPQSRSENGWQRPLAVVVEGVLQVLIPVAHAAAPSVDISSPAIQQITASMERRYHKLKPYYESGAIGLTQDALIAVRTLKVVPLAKRGHLRQLVAAANTDRNALYREIARANGHPEWEEKIRHVFARRWISNAPNGWYYRNDNGQWVQK